MSSSTPVRWGILATGGIAKSFADDLKLLPDAEMVAVGSRSTESADRFAAEHGIPRAYGSWAELAADPDVDVIYVATPHSAHHEATRLCLEAGRPVLCEKPFTLDRAAAVDLVDLAAARGLFLMEAMWTRCLPAIRRLVEVVEDGAIGEVTAVTADFSIAGPFAPQHRLRNPALGGGALLDLGVYPITMAHLFLGAPDRITAVATISPEGVDENTAIALGYASGAVAALHCSIVSQGPVAACVMGTKGRAELAGPFFSTAGFRVVRDGRTDLIELPRRGNGLGYEAEEVMRCLRDGATESQLVPLPTTLEVMGIMDAIRAQIGVSYGSEQGTDGQVDQRGD